MSPHAALATLSNAAEGCAVSTRFCHRKVGLPRVVSWAGQSIRPARRLAADWPSCNTNPADVWTRGLPSPVATEPEAVFHQLALDFRHGCRADVLAVQQIVRRAFRQVAKRLGAKLLYAVVRPR